jgi:hypothetical protein
MNNKLQHFPDFAATTGLKSVNDCEQARSFYSQYAAYNALHPYFDQGEPLVMDDVRDLPPPETPNHLAETRPLLGNGVGDLLAPVVKLLNDTIQCTGFFIARNFIVTAAHCMDIAPGFRRGTDPVSAAKLDRWRPYAVTFVGSNGAGTRRPVFNNVRQYVDPRYVGWSQATYVENFDSAILYVYDQYDNQLPNADPTTMGQNIFPFLRTSLKPSIDNSAAQAWGWGLPDTSALHRAIMSSYNLTSTSTPAPLIKGTSPGGSAPYLCKGDSGGPLTDTYDIADAANNLSSQYVAVGSMASITSSGDCSSNAGDEAGWVRLDQEADFFSRKVKLWYYADCARKKSAAAGTLPDYMECWGKPCTTTNECAGDETCIHPGSELTNCADCGTGTSCGCMHGQCLKQAPPDIEHEPQDN